MQTACLRHRFSYTSLFGAYSAYLFLRTGVVYGPVATRVASKTLD